jgi:hypothetical protein
VCAITAAYFATELGAIKITGGRMMGLAGVTAVDGTEGIAHAKKPRHVSQGYYFDCLDF